VLVCPSYSEGMPNVILEAMASGLAIIASDVGAVNLLVSKNNGWLITGGNRGELKLAIEQAIQGSIMQLDEMKKTSRELSGSFLWDTIITKLIDDILS
jgi:glycosyltransferase involved in cell wall biosynthesis